MRRRAARRGMTFIEIIVGVSILALTVVTAVALFPLSSMLRDRSGGFSRAATIAQRKLEQVRRFQARHLRYPDLQAAGVLDANTASPYTFTTVDALSNELRAGAGTLQLSGVGTDLVRIDVAVSWKDLRGVTNRVNATTFVTAKRAWREP